MNYLLLISLLVLNPVSDTDWNLKKEKSDIQIFTRSVIGSSFDEFKGITVIPNSSLDAVLEVILDVKNYDRLFPDCINPKVLKQEGKYYDIHHVTVKAPWPVKGRDAIYEQNVLFTENEKHALVTLKPLPNFAKENTELIRIQKGTGFWELEEDVNKNVKVTYQFHGEPGGEIPAWLANSFVVTHPFKTLKNLINRVEK